MAPLPVVLCGKNPNVAKMIVAGLLPEYEAIHVVPNPAAGIADLPIILSGSIPPNHAENVGSQNYASLPVAVIVGGGYADEECYSMHASADAVKAITWLKTDNSPLKAGVGPPTGDLLVDFVQKTCEMVKRVLGEIGVGGEGVEGKLHRV